MADSKIIVLLTVMAVLVGGIQADKLSKQLLKSYKALTERLVDLETRIAKCESRDALQRMVMAENIAAGAQVGDNMVTEEAYTGEPIPGNGGAVYTRWGRKTCDGDADLIYEGYMASHGRMFNGSGANYMCLHPEPQWYNVIGGDDAEGSGRGLLYGVEYQGSPDELFDNFNLIGSTFVNQNVPCAVCELTNRHVILQVPARVSCPDGWYSEYWGYLMATGVNGGRSEYVCVDHAPEAVDAGSQGQIETSYVYHVETRCGSIPCPPFIDNYELTCAVCSK